MSDYHCHGYNISLWIIGNIRLPAFWVLEHEECEVQGFLALYGISRVGSSRISWGNPARATAPRAPMTPLPP